MSSSFAFLWIFGDFFDIDPKFSFYSLLTCINDHLIYFYSILFDRNNFFIYLYLKNYKNPTNLDSPR
jgi:hypothetical protein